ncbi:MAG: response regulator transcription factor, partial [Thermoleophilia bacterium]|nr:response regulator transcription factor [Thermoleophilia bacterium]
MIGGNNNMPVSEAEAPFERAVLMPLNVGIAHPSGMLAESLAAVLVNEPDIQLVWSARDSISARALLRDRVCDVLICAQQIEPGGCEVVITYVAESELPTSVVVLIDDEISNTLREAVSSKGGQAPALVQHFSTVLTLVEAIRAAAAGRTFVDPLLVPELLLRERPNGETLTPRETAVLDELSLGLSNKEIAAALNVTIETVKTHVKNVIRKLEVTNRTAAVLQAAQRSAANAAE